MTGPMRKTPLARTPMARGKGAKTKGSRAEAELVQLLREIGFDARRNYRSGADGGGDIIGIPDTSVEAKRCETVKVWNWISQAEAAARPTETAVVAFRRSRSPWYAVVRAEDYFSLVREVQELRGQA